MSLTFEEWLAVIGVLIGLLTGGAALVGLGFSLYNYWQSRPRQRVEADFSVPVDFRRLETFGEFIVVTFINERGHVVVIHEVGFECADGSKAIKTSYTPYDARLPTEVPSGHSARYYFELEDLRSSVQQGKPIPVRAYCRDATGRHHKTSLGDKIRSALLQ